MKNSFFLDEIAARHWFAFGCFIELLLFERIVDEKSAQDLLPILFSRCIAALHCPVLISFSSRTGARIKFSMKASLTSYQQSLVSSNLMVVTLFSMKKVIKKLPCPVCL